jgi:hypothetical protein
MDRLSKSSDAFAMNDTYLKNSSFLAGLQVSRQKAGEILGGKGVQIQLPRDGKRKGSGKGVVGL